MPESPSDLLKSIKDKLGDLPERFAKAYQRAGGASGPLSRLGDYAGRPKAPQLLPAAERVGGLLGGPLATLAAHVRQARETIEAFETLAKAWKALHAPAPTVPAVHPIAAGMASAAAPPPAVKVPPVSPFTVPAVPKAPAVHPMAAAMGGGPKVPTAPRPAPTVPTVPKAPTVPQLPSAADVAKRAPLAPIKPRRWLSRRRPKAIPPSLGQAPKIAVPDLANRNAIPPLPSPLVPRTPERPAVPVVGPARGLAGDGAAREVLDALRDVAKAMRENTAERRKDGAGRGQAPVQGEGQQSAPVRSGGGSPGADPGMLQFARSLGKGASSAEAAEALLAFL